MKKVKYCHPLDLNKLNKKVGYDDVYSTTYHLSCPSCGELMYTYVSLSSDSRDPPNKTTHANYDWYKEAFTSTYGKEQWNLYGREVEVVDCLD
ncbi:leucine tRS [Acrasis kona]|uniref:Leucine tRS n=1 Tax=Acrasis kona TaxID=1008807 RepID=A0AAW2Z0D3_9EUKA